MYNKVNNEIQNIENKISDIRSKLDTLDYLEHELVVPVAIGVGEVDTEFIVEVLKEGVKNKKEKLNSELASLLEKKASTENVKKCLEFILRIV